MLSLESIAEVLGYVPAAILMPLGYLLVSVLLLWTIGAIYFDVARARWYAWPLILLCVASVVAAIAWWQPLWQVMVVILSAFVVFMVWWLKQKPSNDRDWNPNFAVLPRFEIEGDRITVHNVRNTEYRTSTDFTPHYEQREYQLSKLIGLDGVIIYWGSSFISHPMLVFDFGDEGRLCISIEVRYRQGQKYGFFRSLYRQQEIMYVVSDERDAILKRAKYLENHDVYLYRLQVENEELKKLFLEYVVSANALVEHPRWYHGLTTNCTTSIYRQRTREIGWDWRWLFNGKLDEMIYDDGWLDQSVPFAELKRHSRINELAAEAPEKGFGDFLREKLKYYRASS